MLFIEKYLRLERRTRVWIQITELQAKKLEQEKGLLPGIAHLYEINGQLMRKYHIDCHAEFETMQPQLSIRKPLNGPELIFVGQHKTVIQRFLFSARAWFNHMGAT